MHKRPIRIAYLLTHPIQYQSPLLKRLSLEVDLEVTALYQSDISLGINHDKGFGGGIKWDVPLLEGYSYEFLPALGRKDILSYWRPFNYGIRNALKRGNYDVIIVNGYNRPLHWITICIAKSLGIDVYIRDESTMFSKNRSIINILIKKIFFKVLGNVVNGFLAIGSANSNYYEHHGISYKRIFMTPYAVNNYYFQEKARHASTHRDDLRQQLHLEPGRPVILYASKLLKRKRALDLLDAYMIASKRLNVVPYLLFIGDGELRPELEQRIHLLCNDSVRFLGFKNQSELPTYYDLCDVFVLPSFYETWGLVVNEVMNAGRPVIVTDLVGCGPDLIRNGENGYIVPAGNVSVIADKLVDILKDKDKLRTMGLRSLEIISRWSYEEDIMGIRKCLGLH